MATFSDKASAILATVKDAARDMESDLGKASRTYTYNPDFGRVSAIVDPQTFSLAAVQPTRTTRANQFLVGHHHNAQAGRQFVTDLIREYGQTLTVDEQTLVTEITTLTQQMEAVTDYPSALALIQTIN